MSEQNITIDGIGYMMLLKKLQSATAKYRSSDGATVQRDAWSESIVAICDFLRALPDADGAALQILAELLGDLRDLDEGRRPQRMKPEKKLPGRRTGDVDTADLATAAALVDCLVSGGLSEQAAARKVAAVARKIRAALPKTVRKSTRSSDGDRPDHERILDWRARLRAGTLNDGDVAQQIFTNVKQRVREIAAEAQYSELEATHFFLERWPSFKGK